MGKGLKHRVSAGEKVHVLVIDLIVCFQKLIMMSEGIRKYSRWRLLKSEDRADLETAMEWRVLTRAELTDVFGMEVFAEMRCD